EIFVHLERSETDIDAIEVAEEVAEGHERHDPPADLADDPRFHAKLLPDPDAAHARHYRYPIILPRVSIKEKASCRRPRPAGGLSHCDRAQPGRLALIKGSSGDL